MECHTSLDLPLRFDPRVQGFVCAQCAGREAFVVPNEVAEALEAVLRLPVAEFASRAIGDDALFELRSLAGTLRRNFLGHELKSFEVLASIVR
jgi:recombinational DNA repair protein (RecF pathway)